jgi:hypothetical protein
VEVRKAPVKKVQQERVPQEKVLPEKAHQKKAHPGKGQEESRPVKEAGKAHQKKEAENLQAKGEENHPDEIENGGCIITSDNNRL